MLKKLGPGILIAAAFIGPGTITVCTIAGVRFGYVLLWAMLLSAIATVILQEMAARLGLVTGKGLTEVLKAQLSMGWLRLLVLGIILAAIVLGNAAYEAGNISGATLGLEAIFGSSSAVIYPWIIGIFAFVLLYIGSYKVLEKAFVTLVGLMSLSFIITAIITRPNLIEIFKGLLVPEIPEGSILTIIALIGTTVVPYNLFLHASLVQEKWDSVNDLSSARADTFLSVMIGGIVSMTVIVAANSIPGEDVTNALEMAKSLEPLYGNAAKYCMGIGLLAAGITSAITAPLAAAYVVNNCFGWGVGLKDWKFRTIWVIILLAGVSSLSFKFKPLEIIQFAQIANGLLLPVMAILLLWLVNRPKVLGKYRNTIWHNVLTIGIILLVIVLGIKSIFGVIGQ